jgi:hypothetical protein
MDVVEATFWVLVCKWAILGHFAATYIASVHTDFNGRSARDSMGFMGFIIGLFIYGGAAFIYWKAGAFPF